MDDSGPVEVRFIGNEAAIVYSNGITMVRKEDGFVFISLAAMEKYW